MGPIIECENIYFPMSEIPEAETETNHVKLCIFQRNLSSIYLKKKKRAGPGLFLTKVEWNGTGGVTYYSRTVQVMPTSAWKRCAPGDTFPSVSATPQAVTLRCFKST